MPVYPKLGLQHICSLTPDLYGRVSPIQRLLCAIDVPVADVDATHKCGVAVDNGDFTVVTVIAVGQRGKGNGRSEEHTSELQSLMRISYAVFCLKKKQKHKR